METYQVKVDSAGRISLPKELRDMMGFTIGSKVNILADNSSVKLSNQNIAIKNLQEAARKFVPAGVSLVDELIETRREEAKRFEEKYKHLFKKSNKSNKKGKKS